MSSNALVGNFIARKKINIGQWALFGAWMGTVAS